jgi:hypothetical protein
MTVRYYRDACFTSIMEAQDDELHIEGFRQLSQASGCQGRDVDFSMSFYLSLDGVSLPGNQISTTDYHPELDCGINDCVGGSVDAHIRCSWLETHDADSLVPASCNEAQYHRSESCVHYQPNDPMMDIWSWYETSVRETIDGPDTTKNVLASGTEYVLARAQNIG